MIRFALPLLLGLATSLADASMPELRRSGFLGLQVAPVPGGGAGVLVQGLAPGGSAGAAGLRAGDVIVALDGREVAGRDAFVQAARRLKAGDAARVTVRRDGAPLALRVPVKPRPVESAQGIEVRYEAVAVDGHLRRTLLTAPAGGGRHPAILFVTGVGCFSQEFTGPGEPVRELLHGLTRRGFVTLRVEKSGMGDSEGPACGGPEVDFEAELRGYVAGLRALKAHPRVDPRHVFIVGLSIGGVHAPLIEREEPVKGTVVINTAAKPFYEYLLETRRRQMTLRGMAPEAIDDAMLRVARCNQRLLVERMAPEALLRELPECRGEVDYPAPHTFMQQWAALNMARAWKEASAPLLVVIGRSDFVATVGDSPYLVGLVNRFRPGSARLLALEGMDHGLTRAASMAESMAREGPGEFEPRVLDATAQWLLERVREAPGARLSGRPMLPNVTGAGKRPRAAVM